MTISGAVRDALRLGAIGYDAVKHLVLCRIEHRPPIIAWKLCTTMKTSDVTEMLDLALRRPGRKVTA